MTEVVFLDKVWCEGLAPEPQLTVTEWAEEHRVLPATSSEPGQWRTDRTPYLAGIMDALSTGSKFERVVFQKGAQIGGTEVGLNWLGYVAHHAPGLALAVMPSLDMVRRNTKTRIDPMIEATPVLRDRIASPRAKDSNNTAFSKSFPGGQLVMTGANSAAGLRSTPARYLFLDEVDGYPADADGEGDPVDLATKRTVTFRGRRKIFMVSTPTIKGESRIEKAYLDSDQQRYHVPCPHCAEKAPIVWRNIAWPEGRRDLAYLICEHCDTPINERHKARMLRQGEWVATETGDGRTAGFHLSSLYSPFETWGEVAVQHGKVKGDPSRLKTWVNTALGETWEDLSGQAMDATGLASRREPLGDLLPDRAAVLTAGVDVQNNRLEVQVVAWGRDEESWIIGHHVLYGDPSGARLWADLDTYLAQSWTHSRALPNMHLSAVCVDSGGHHTAQAYELCRHRLARRIWAIKGRGGVGVVPWPRKLSKGKGGAPVFVIGVDAIKDQLAARLAITEPGPGCVHFSDTLDQQFFDQLTAERVRTKYVNGRPVRQWVPVRDGARNEALDCYVYAGAALRGSYAAGMRLAVLADDVEAAPMRGEGPVTVKAPVPTTIRSSWMDA